MNKFNDILEQFAREIDQTSEIFERHKVGCGRNVVVDHYLPAACMCLLLPLRTCARSRSRTRLHRCGLIPPASPCALPKPLHPLLHAAQDSPTVTKNQPQVAGAIKWARSLLARLKQTMAKLLSTEEEIIRTTELGQGVEAKFKVSGPDMGFSCMLVCDCHVNKAGQGMGARFRVIV